MDTAHTDELIDDGPDAEAQAFDRWLEEASAALDEQEDIVIDLILDARAERAAFPTVTVPVECNICGAGAVVPEVVVDASVGRVVDVVDVFAGPDGAVWTAWVTRDGVVAANCGHRECQ